ncbi:NAD-dependent epimerase/dehydratase family protein [Amycolatopsis rhizosphaerae]|uniref:NAD-dependent epimerase/dehydratase family protein n=1 Tax=Amycolatopsis rhizosphaerae TaxID=2053003 RepID=A0A558C7G3_9PSEU|nr:NAD(P)H-binding protein [Amycolatopsis rhizosphaerae]TVT44735.1 NAD-dependent epimerase/dehydratase family protein [Amycolatopsis rhizosphaerae]
MIVVTGGTGQVGGQLVRELLAAGKPVTAVSRQPEAPGLPEGARHRQADLSDPDGLRPVLDGAEALFLLVAGDSPQGILDAAKAGGVRRIVLLSSQGAGTRPETYRHARGHEEALMSSSVDWTVLRPGGFASNTFAWAESVRTRRMVEAPFGDVALPVIDPADIAAVAAAVLCEPSHNGRVYELTGPETITPREQVRVLAQALGEPVEFAEQTRAEARARMLPVMPEAVVEGTLDILGDPLPAESRVSPDAEGVLGRPPRTYADWVARNLAAFR